MSDAPMKRCSKCGNEYPATPDYFYRHSGLRDGLHSNCKACHPGRKNPIVDPGFKICGTCKQRYPATTDHFHKSKNGKYGLDSKCKSCAREYSRTPERRERMSELRRTPERREYNRKYYRLPKTQEKLREYQQSPQYKTRMRMRRQTDEYREKNRAYNKRPHRIEYRRNYERSEKGRFMRKLYNGKPERKEYMRRYKEENWQRIKLLNRRRRSNPVTRQKDSQRRKSPKQRLYNRVYGGIRRSRERNLPTQWTSNDWERCLNYWDNRCCVCGRQASAFYAIAQDHWIPVTDPCADNPGTVPWNMLPLCHSLRGAAPDDPGCNNLKSNKPADKWLIEMFDESRAAEVIDRVDAYFESVRR